jgi:hypothetical protein
LAVGVKPQTDIRLLSIGFALLSGETQSAASLPQSTALICLKIFNIRRKGQCL